MTRNWNVRIDYRHTDYGTKSGLARYDNGKGLGTGRFSSTITDDRVTGGLAYKF
jgi:opacity protein-like surface antigen